MNNMSVVTITKENFEQEVLRSEKPVLLDFSAEWCGPCHMIAPVLEEIAGEKGDLKVCKIDIDAQLELAQAFQVTSIPTLVAIKDGQVKQVAVGVQSKETLLNMFL